MTDRRRRALILAVADHMVTDMSEPEADQALEAAGAKGQTPRNWGHQDDGTRRALAIGLLGRQTDAVLDTLALMTGVEPPNGDVQAEGEASGTRAATDEDGPIFVVHGHDHGRLHELVRVLERTTGREVTVLPEQPNSGRTIVEKFERHAAAAAYAMSHAGIAVDRSRMP